jgi:replicative DNA helicase
MIQDVLVGDKLLGPDGLVRNVINKHNGFDNLYKVTQIRGMSYVVNSKHILSLMPRHSHKNIEAIADVPFNVPVNEFIKYIDWHKKDLKGWVPDAMFFDNNEKVFDPWCIGNWLADGTQAKSSVTVHCNDTEIIDYWGKIAGENGFRGDAVSQHENSLTRTIPLTFGFYQVLTSYNLISNKHIPDVYKFNSYNNRIELLIGILDGDAYLTNCGYEIIFKEKRLCDDVAFVARSLGLKVRISNKFCKCQNFVGAYYYKMFIFGNTEKLNLKLKRKQAHTRRQIKNPLITGISVDAIGYGEYFGVETDGDHLFILEDFTVVHNSTSISRIAYELALAKQKIGMVFLEETYEQTVKRMISCYCDVNYNKFKFAPTKYAEKDKIKEALDWAGDKFYFYKEGFNTSKFKYLMNTVHYLVHVVLSNLIP